MYKRYYRPLKSFPEGTDRLESAVQPPVTEERLAGLLDEYFRCGNMKAAVGYLILRYGLWEEAMNLGRDSRQRTGFRATWALEWAYEQSGDRLPEWFAGRMADDFAASDNGSLHRVYAKMLCDMMRFGGFRPDDAQAHRLAERCFDLLIGSKTKGAVQFWCMEILYELSPRIDWIAEALEDTVLRISESPGCQPGMASACRDILRRLNSFA